MQAQDGAALPNLERNAARAPMRTGRRVDLLELVADLRDDEAGRLREVRIEQLVDLVACVEVGIGRGCQPDQRGHGKQRDQQPRRERSTRPRGASHSGRGGR